MSISLTKVAFFQEYSNLQTPKNFRHPSPKCTSLEIAEMAFTVRPTAWGVEKKAAQNFEKFAFNYHVIVSFGF